MMKNLTIEQLSEATISLTALELMSIFKSILLENLNIDLDKLNIISLIKYSNNRLHITLDTEELRDTNPILYLDMIQSVKRMFSPYIFTVNTAIDVNILINKLFSGYDYYSINEDMTIDIYY